MPITMGALANYLVPLQIGSNDTAFPRINNLAFVVLLPSMLFAVLSCLIDEGPGSGWTLYPPLTSLQSHSGSSIDMAIFALHLSGLSSIFGAINLMVTIINMRANGMDYSKLPLFVWSVLITAVLIILALPVLAAGLTMLLMDRNFNTSFFVVSGGGDPLLYEHIFYKNPVLILIWLTSGIYLILTLNNLKTRSYLINKLIHPSDIVGLYKKENNISFIKSNINLDSFYLEYNKYYNKKPSSEFLEWFIGFFEGNGEFINYKNKRVSLCIFQKEKEILFFIKQNLSMGNIQYYSKKKNIYQLIISKQTDLIILANLFNGNITLPIKLLKFQIFLSNLNMNLIKQNLSIINFISHCRLPSLNDYWLSGLTDANGYFSIYFFNDFKYSIQYLISQKYDINKIILEYINFNLFNFEINYVNSHKNYYELKINDIHNCNKLISLYFDNFPLFSKKLENYNKWKYILNQIEKKNHLDKIKRIELIKISKLIKDPRGPGGNIPRS